MKYIDISTSHNISIRFELATVLERILAWGIDTTIIVVYSSLISAAVSWGSVLWYILVFFVFSFYHLAFEIMNNGQSPGKFLLKIRVVTLHGRTAKPNDYFLRWIFRILEISGTAGALASIYISSTEKHQRIGDLLAQTTVIKLTSGNKYDLDALININNKTREVVYPKVSMYSDDDLMMAKDAITRYKRKPNVANKKFLIELKQRFATDLNTEIKNADSVKFLEAVLLDYISVTR